MSFPCRRPMILSYTSDGSVAGILPARTKISPSSNSSNFLNICSNSSSWITGPNPLISLSSLDFTLTLIRVIPSRTLIKSGLNPSSFAPDSITSPVNPAINPSPTLSTPRLASRWDTLIPFPPQKMYSLVVLFTCPNVRLSTLIT